ncbi:Casein kinase II subunit beta [Kluyveromyces marxianus]
MSLIEAANDSSDSGAYEEWIPTFCSRFGHEYFCQVPTDFIEDDFNLTGLSQEVAYYRKALDTILDLESTSDEEDEKPANGKGHDDQQQVTRSIIEHSAEQLYGLIHASIQLLPCGLSDTLGKQTVRLYCPSCQDLYTPQSSRHLSLEGAYWGTSFPGVFLKHFKELEDYVEKKSKDTYELKIFGFSIAKEAVCGPRMRWLRQYPKTDEEWEEFKKCEFEIPSSLLEDAKDTDPNSGSNDINSSNFK